MIGLLLSRKSMMHLLLSIGPLVSVQMFFHENLAARFDRPVDLSPSLLERPYDGLRKSYL